MYLFTFAEAPDLKQEERLQELESCSGVGSTSDDTEVREVSSRPSTPGLSVVSGINITSPSHPLPNIYSKTVVPISVSDPVLHFVFHKLKKSKIDLCC